MVSGCPEPDNGDIRNKDMLMITTEDRSAIQSKVIAIATDTVADWGLDLPGPITADTKLIEDLNFESIDIVQFAVGIERAFDHKGLPFEKFFIRDGAFVDDVTISELTDFLCTELVAS
jgi:acyl carrier protein